MTFFIPSNIFLEVVRLYIFSYRKKILSTLEIPYVALFFAHT
jgi:hypothetical protein